MPPSAIPAHERRGEYYPLNGGQQPSKNKNPGHKTGVMVGGIGLEPTTFAMSTQRSNQLS